MKYICQEVGLPNILPKQVDKKTIKEGIFFKHIKDLKMEMKQFEKLDDISNGDFRKTQPYM